MGRLPNGIAAKPDSTPLVALLLAAAVGIVIDRHFPLGLGAWLLAAVASWGLWRWIWPREANLSPRRHVSAWPLLASAAAVAGAWHHCHWNLRGENDIARFAARDAKPLAMQALVTRGARVMPAPPRDPLRTLPIGDRTRIELRVLAVRDGREWREASGLVTLVVAGIATAPAAGDRLTLFAQMRTAEPPDNPGEFDFGS